MKGKYITTQIKITCKASSREMQLIQKHEAVNKARSIEASGRDKVAA